MAVFTLYKRKANNKLINELIQTNTNHNTILKNIQYRKSYITEIFKQHSWALFDYGK